MVQCPCGSTKDQNECCLPFINGQEKPQTPEQLMRSRYSAYTQANIDYIAKTMQGPAFVQFNPKDSLSWSKKVIWIGLKVLKNYMETPSNGFVEFIASYMEHGQLKTIHELSEFHLIGNQWFYIDGTQRPTEAIKKKIGRNTPCPCGSGKKFKNCHEASRP